MCTSTTQQLEVVSPCGATSPRPGCTRSCAACPFRNTEGADDRSTIDRLVDRIRMHRLAQGRIGR